MNNQSMIERKSMTKNFFIISNSRPARRIYCLIFASIFFLCSCGPSSSVSKLAIAEEDSQLYTEKCSHYDMDIILDTESKALLLSQSVEYVNRSEETFDKLYFHLYPNAFKDKGVAPFSKEEIEGSVSPGPYPNGFSPGGIEIESVLSGDKSLRHEYSGKGDGLLRVFLNAPIQPGESAQISLKCKVKLPNCVSRFGYNEDSYNICNFYPIAAVYDDEGWNLDPYYMIGDPFYSESSDYTARISIPKNYSLATTGRQTKVNEGASGMQTVTVSAKAVRDFAFVAGKKATILSRQVGNTTVYSYFTDKKGGLLALDVAAESIKVFNDMFGEYPYGQFSVVQANFYIGGMEYPNIVLIDEALYKRENFDSLEYVVAHETAHQWWYGLVGNDEIDEPWLDEALTEYSTIKYYEKRYGKDTRDSIFTARIKNMADMVASISAQRRFDLPVFEYENLLEYSCLVYSRGAMMLLALEEKMGEPFFAAALKEYYESNKFGIATKDELLDKFNAYSGDWVKGFFEDWASGNSIKKPAA